MPEGEAAGLWAGLVLAGGAPRARHVAFEARRCSRRTLVR
eukprot:CAMPEP_0180039266 /NCGR_PEP_ID=MMETSP0984-20121128/32748_1 /TAXON_ID=483367 /ORGANISM="non described non described, Strain CCMP 2436" /LENGTH=39 /DNA_ID= /DNA_START= /DNA_END= /DNA_ORIENTATION=